MISPTPSGGTVRGLAEVGHALAPPGDDPAVDAGVRLLVAGSAVGAFLQMSCLGIAAMSSNSAVAALSLSGAALSSLTLLGLVVWLSRREAGRTSLAPPEPVAPPLLRAERHADVEPQRQALHALDRMAHDLNELMAVVVTQAELLRERRGGESYQLEAILEAGRRSAGLASDLVALARQKCGRDPQQSAMKYQAFAVKVSPSEPPHAGSEPPKGPGVAKAPAASDPPRASAPPTSSGRDSVPLQSGRRLRSDQLNAAHGVILLVDDEELLLKTTRRMLEQRGFRVVTAGDGATAIEVAQKTADIRVLLTDLSLPGMDGRELARRLRWTLPELRVLFMSGFDAETSGLSAGQGDSFLSKPFTARELEDRVSDLFGSSDSDATAQQG